MIKYYREALSVYRFKLTFGGLIVLILLCSLNFENRINIFNMSYMDDFIHKLNMIPPQADRLLRTIRQLDKEVEELRLQL